MITRSKIENIQYGFREKEREVIKLDEIKRFVKYLGWVGGSIRTVFHNSVLLSPNILNGMLTISFLKGPLHTLYEKTFFFCLSTVFLSDFTIFVRQF